MTMGMADTLMVSGVGEAAVSSVSLVDSLNILIIQILSALATGGAVIASQYLGRKDEENASHSAAQLYSVLGISTITVGVVCMLLSRPILRGVFGSIDDDVMRFAQQYFLISAVVVSLHRAVQRRRGAVPGAGQQPYQYAGKPGHEHHQHRRQRHFNLRFPHGCYRRGAGNTDWPRVRRRVHPVAEPEYAQPAAGPALRRPAPRREPIMKVLSIGIPSGLENGMFQIGKLCVSSLTSTLGTSAIAANAVANSVSTLANIPGATISLAMIPVIGRCLGAARKSRLSATP